MFCGSEVSCAACSWEAGDSFVCGSSSKISVRFDGAASGPLEVMVDVDSAVLLGVA